MHVEGSSYGKPCRTACRTRAVIGGRSRRSADSSATAIRRFPFSALQMTSMQISNGRAQPQPINFRDGVESDFSPCADLWMRALAVRDGIPLDPQKRRRALEKLAGTGNILSIAESASRIHGFAMAMDSTRPGMARSAHLSLLAVDPDS